jgi:hypothetical protein
MDDTYVCSECYTEVDEGELLEQLGDNEDELVVIVGSGMCWECYEKHCLEIW